MSGRDAISSILAGLTMVLLVTGCTGAASPAVSPSPAQHATTPTRTLAPTSTQAPTFTPAPTPSATPSASPAGLTAGDGQSISEKVMRAWASGDPAAIEAVYSPDVVMWVDGQTLAKDRDQIASVIRGAIQCGNLFRQVGPVIEYQATNGDLYVTTTIDVVGRDHPKGDPVIGFYRVRGAGSRGQSGCGSHWVCNASPVVSADHRM